jgi:ParB-like chromosome segregation protein Spo0J
VRTREFEVDNTSHDHEQLRWAHDWLESEHDIVQVPVASLMRGDSPRLKGESKADAQLMMAAVDVPPIIVHPATMTVIDGGRRVTAAKHRHQDLIAAWFFHGTVEEAYVLAVAANAAHGLSLCTKDRKAAAARLLGMYPDSSNRAIADTTGLSHNTVAAIRRRWPTGQFDQLARRRGRDGKSRPLSSDDGRQAAADLIRAGHNKSLRKIAREANVSRGTVQDVRDRLLRGVSPLVSAAPRGAALNVHFARAQAALKRLWNDPAVRSHDKGKAMLDLLSHSLRTAIDAQAAIRSAPEYCRNAMAEYAAACGDSWHRVAKDLRSKIQAG